MYSHVNRHVGVNRPQKADVCTVLRTQTQARNTQRCARSHILRVYGRVFDDRRGEDFVVSVSSRAVQVPGLALRGARRVALYKQLKRTLHSLDRLWIRTRSPNFIFFGCMNVCDLRAKHAGPSLASARFLLWLCSCHITRENGLVWFVHTLPHLHFLPRVIPSLPSASFLRLGNRLISCSESESHA